MKIKYSKEADILLIELRDGTPMDSIDLKEGVILHLDDEGLPLEIEILDASKIATLEDISIIGFITISSLFPFFIPSTITISALESIFGWTN